MFLCFPVRAPRTAVPVSSYYIPAAGEEPGGNEATA